MTAVMLSVPAETLNLPDDWAFGHAVPGFVVRHELCYFTWGFSYDDAERNVHLRTIDTHLPKCWALAGRS